ncbi:MAG: hypothetical protein Q8Q56_01175 [Alphaproteobacteria bacterium]|nr:hypothetical protein [Alphaproteobacteria bacterium]
MYVFIGLILCISIINAAEESKSIAGVGDVPHKVTMNTGMLKLVKEKLEKDMNNMARASMFCPPRTPTVYHTSIEELEALLRHYYPSYGPRADFILALQLIRANRIEEGREHYNRVWDYDHNNPVVFSITKLLGLIPADTEEYSFDEELPALNWDNFNLDAVVNGTFDEEDFLRRYKIGK